MIQTVCRVFNFPYIRYFTFGILCHA